MRFHYTNMELYRIIVASSYDGIMVSDGTGKILLVNEAARKSLELPLNQIIGKRPSDMIMANVYTHSTIMETIKTRKSTTGIVITRGKASLSTSIPVFDDNNELELVITNNRTDEVFDSYFHLLRREKEKRHNYQNISAYLENYNIEKIIYESKKMSNIITICKQIAQTDGTVMILGETGVGKEMIAKLIHSASRRDEAPFIPVNCSAIPQELFESEFFGYKPNSFTGASSKGKKGLAKLADKGTLFLDEIGDLSMPMQAKLLRFIESGEYLPIGSIKNEHSDVRIIAATNRNLRDMMAEGRFREDLYYRLQVLPIKIPPLRDRPEDIKPISQYYIDKYNHKYNHNLRLTDYDFSLLAAYTWPGNIRELRNTMERTVILNDLNKARKTILSLINNRCTKGKMDIHVRPSRYACLRDGRIIIIDSVIEEGKRYRGRDMNREDLPVVEVEHSEIYCVMDEI